MEGFVVYEEDMMGFHSDHKYSINETIANKHYQELIKKINKEKDVVLNNDDFYSDLGFDENLVEEKLTVSKIEKDGIVKRFRIIYEYTVSDESGTEHDEAVCWIVMKKIFLEE